MNIAGTWIGKKSGVGTVIVSGAASYVADAGDVCVSYTWASGGMAGASACTLGFFLKRFVKVS